MTQKMVHRHNPGSAFRIFFKFITTNGASGYMKIIFIIFSKKKIGAKEPFWIQKVCVLMTLDLLQECFLKILHTEKCQ